MESLKAFFLEPVDLAKVILICGVEITHIVEGHFFID